MNDTIEIMKSNSIAQLKESLKYKHGKALKEKRVGNWIVTIELAGGGVSKFCKIYNANTLEEHYRYFQTISCVCEDAPEDIKAFYQRIEDGIFEGVCNLAAKWD